MKYIDRILSKSNKNNENFFDLYHVSGFFEFLMVIVLVIISENKMVQDLSYGR